MAIHKIEDYGGSTNPLRRSYEYTNFTPSDTVYDYRDKQETWQDAYDKFMEKGFTFSQGNAYKDVMDKILNREKFSYDLNGDALYQQYKDKYIQQGKLAMADTMGQASAMTGGYGNSYAASVGNQAYQASLQQLNDIVPELYQMAYDRYNQEGQDLYNQYGMLSNERSTEYGMWSDEGKRIAGERDYWGTEKDKAWDREFAEHTVSEGYKAQDIADYNSWVQWEASQKLAQDQFAWQKSQASKTTPITLTAAEYNEVLTNAADYAQQGKTALDNYLRGMMSRGLTEGEANNIRQQYFPTELPKKTNGGGGGGNRHETHDSL